MGHCIPGGGGSGGERLHESAALESYRDPCIAYDAEADTALFALALDDIAPCQMETGDVYTVEFSRILPSVEPFSHLFRGNF